MNEGIKFRERERPTQQSTVAVVLTGLRSVHGEHTAVVLVLNRLLSLCLSSRDCCRLLTLLRLLVLVVEQAARVVFVLNRSL